jgi:hypothetical protein
MAVTLKRKRGAVSYREPSSDEDLADTETEILLPRKRAAPVRRSARHQSTEAEQPSQRRRHAVSSEPSARSKNTKPRHSLRRGGKRRISYQDASSEDDGDQDFEEEMVEQRRPQMRTTASRQSHKGKKTERRPGRTSGRSPRKSLGAPLKPKIGRSVIVVSGETF